MKLNRQQHEAMIAIIKAILRTTSHHFAPKWGRNLKNGKYPRLSRLGRGGRKGPSRSDFFAPDEVQGDHHHTSNRGCRVSGPSREGLVRYCSNP
jgi:hypothetical protein